jgi:hypothetical protein
VFAGKDDNDDEQKPENPELSFHKLFQWTPNLLLSFLQSGIELFYSRSIF